MVKNDVLLEETTFKHEPVIAHGRKVDGGVRERTKQTEKSAALRKKNRIRKYGAVGKKKDPWKGQRKQMSKNKRERRNSRREKFLHTSCGAAPASAVACEEPAPATPELERAPSKDSAAKLEPPSPVVTHATASTPSPAGHPAQAAGGQSPFSLDAPMSELFEGVEAEPLPPVQEEISVMPSKSYVEDSENFEIVYLEKKGGKGNGGGGGRAHYDKKAKKKLKRTKRGQRALKKYAQSHKLGTKDWKNRRRQQRIAKAALNMPESIGEAAPIEVPSETQVKKTIPVRSKKGDCSSMSASDEFERVIKIQKPGKVVLNEDATPVSNVFQALQKKNKPSQRLRRRMARRRARENGEKPKQNSRKNRFWAKKRVQKKVEGDAKPVQNESKPDKPNPKRRRKRFNKKKNPEAPKAQNQRRNRKKGGKGGQSKYTPGPHAVDL